MPVKQGDISLLNHPTSQELLTSKIPARFAYLALDGTPRVVPIWFHWTGSEVVLGTPPNSPKVKSLKKNRKVAITIDSDQFPHKVLLIRGTAGVEEVKGVVPEYAIAAQRYFGEEQGKGWVKQLASQSKTMIRIAIKPEWVALIDFQTRFPSAIST
jgi:general stress protein 26